MEFKIANEICARLSHYDIVISVIPYCDCYNRICDHQTSNCIGIVKAPQEHRAFDHSWFQEWNRFDHLCAIQIRSIKWCKRQFSQHAPYFNRWISFQHVDSIQIIRSILIVLSLICVLLEHSSWFLSLFIDFIWPTFTQNGFFLQLIINNNFDTYTQYKCTLARHNNLSHLEFLWKYNVKKKSVCLFVLLCIEHHNGISIQVLCVRKNVWSVNAKQHTEKNHSIHQHRTCDEIHKKRVLNRTLRSFSSV